MWNVPRSVGRVFGVSLLIALALSGVQCSKGSSGSGSGGFNVISFSVTRQSPPVFLNDVITVVFSEAVDPSSVLSGIFIYTSASAGSNRARGTWSVNGATCTWTPELPTNTNFTDGGLLPDTEYTICVPRAGDSCAVFLQNSPGVRTAGGRTIAQTRTEAFRTVTISTPFRPEVPERRPEVERAWVVDAAGVTQELNPITNLVAGQTFAAGILTTIQANPPTTMSVPNFQYTVAPLTKVVTSPININTNLVSKTPVTVTLAQPSQPIATDEFKDRGGVLTITDTSTNPPITASWAIASNNGNQIVTFQESGPNFDAVGFSANGPFTATVSQGITRQVAPGDISAATEIKVQFDEPLDPSAALIDNFEVYQVTQGSPLNYAAIALASTLQGASPKGFEHEVINGKSVVTLRARSSLPQSQPNAPATIIVAMSTAQPANEIAPSSKANGLRDLNGFPLAYPKRTGYVLGLDAMQNVTTVAHIQPLLYRNANTPPADVQVVWGFQTRGDTQVRNAVVENFTTPNDRANDCYASAAWSRAGQAGLYSTNGYGGNGELGDEIISSAVELDSDTGGVLAPDGVVEFNYNRLEVTNNGTLTLKGSMPIRINCITDLIVAGTIDASGLAGGNASSGKASVVGLVVGGRGGPGAGRGGDSNTKPNDPVGALPIDLRGKPGYPKASRCTDLNKSDNRLITIVEPNCGGGTGGNRGRPSGITLRNGCSGNGGGHGGDGDQTDFLCGIISSFGRDFGKRWVVTSGPSQVDVITAGTGGGGGGNTATSTTNPTPADDIVAGAGGGGGGGVELVAAGMVDVTTSGNILSNGGAGGAGHMTMVNTVTVRGGWGAGGSGGSVWISGTSVSVASGAKIEAIGGIGNPNPTNPPRTGNGGLGYIIIRDRGTSPNIGSNNINPPQEASRTDYSPTNNGNSEAVSRWYDSGTATPNWAFDSNDTLTGEVVPGQDLTFLNAPLSGQKVYIEFQGAPDVNGNPDPNPANWIPNGNTMQDPCAAWTPDANVLRSAATRHIRFRVRFEIGMRNKTGTPPNIVSISRVVINYQ